MKDTEHETNVDNKYQGEFKVAALDYDLLNYSARIEQLYSQYITRVLVITCNNQVPPENRFDPDKMTGAWQGMLFSYSVYGEFQNQIVYDES